MYQVHLSFFSQHHFLPSKVDHFLHIFWCEAEHLENEPSPRSQNKPHRMTPPAANKLIEFSVDTYDPNAHLYKDALEDALDVRRKVQKSMSLPWLFKAGVEE